MTTKTYAAKSSVTRAMKQQGVAADQYTIEMNADGKFYAVMKDHFDTVTEAEHASHRGEDKAKKPRNGNCAKVWEMADKMVGSKRSEVIAACVEAGINLGTSKTQYQQWFASKRG